MQCAAIAGMIAELPDQSPSPALAAKLVEQAHALGWGDSHRVRLDGDPADYPYETGNRSKYLNLKPKEPHETPPIV